MGKDSYPNYSVYLQEGGQLKKPYSTSKRVLIFDLNEARLAAARCFNRYKGTVDVLILRYDNLYDATIVQVINREEKHNV